MSKPSVDELLRGSTKAYEPSIATTAALESLIDASRAEAVPGRRVRASMGADLAGNSVDPTDQFDPDLVEHVRELISCLSPLDRENIELVYWEGFTQQEVATILGKPSATIRSRLSRARAARPARGKRRRLVNGILLVVACVTLGLVPAARVRNLLANSI